MPGSFFSRDRHVGFLVLVSDHASSVIIELYTFSKFSLLTLLCCACFLDFVS